METLSKGVMFRIGIQCGGLVKLLDRRNLVVRDLSRDLYYHLDQLVAPVPAVERWKALTAHPQDSAGLCPGGNSKPGLAVKRGNLDSAPKDRLGERNRHFAEEVIALALEQVVFLDPDHDKKVALWRARFPGFSLAGQPQARTGSDSGRDLNR